MEPIRPSRSFGICLGAANLNLVELTESVPGKIELSGHQTIPHSGNPIRHLKHILTEQHIDGSLLGTTGRKYRELLNLPSIIEPEATEYAYAWISSGERKHDVIVSAGAETFMAYTLDSRSRISGIISGNKCASGTGEFFLQQIRRMNISLQEALELAGRSAHPHELSGRCSVFCKSDCTHALNKGESIADIAAGLSIMIGRKIEELLIKSRARTALLVGGTAINPVVVNYLKQRFERIDVPDEALFFEALGAGLWALKKKIHPNNHGKSSFRPAPSSFRFLPGLNDYRNRVSFKECPYDSYREGDNCLLGLDVGSTTTKAILMRRRDNQVLTSAYLRTNGNPVNASRECYASLLAQLDGRDPRISGIGITGSGRYIAALHAGTEGIINEIIAHAKAAAFYDPEVDTIYEIGGQDAKYTYLNNGVPSDYAMNEACSAGTGSFLEESAFESLGIRMEEIAGIALKAEWAPNFSDQCAAFISSDIHTALQEGIGRDEVIAGLVYSICQNYLNRVKGSRQTGNKVFMQGGVCYNRAVPLAMAALMDKEIIVPPEPGLMGAFGVALELSDLLRRGVFEESSYTLSDLAGREVQYGRTFVCAGKPEDCDRRCTINMIHVAGKKIPFGGACNKYYNLMRHVSFDTRELNHVERRIELLFEHGRLSPTSPAPHAPRLGINRSFHTYTLFPFYSTFFTELGCEVILPETPQASGMDKGMTSFCLAAKLSLGFAEELIAREPDYLFMPQIKEMHVSDEDDYRIEYQTTCMFLQGEPWYIKATHLRQAASAPKLIAPVLNLMHGFDAEDEKFVTIAEELGFSAKAGEEAHRKAYNRQLEFIQAKKAAGRIILADLERNPDRFAVVLFGRPYNAFAGEANKGLPHKFASRGIEIIPFDFLPYQDEPNFRETYWEMGQKIIKAARIVERHPQLYACYLTNFLCAVDSMMITHFRDLMGRKPSLTIEVDTHTADAGVNTRVEAFLDIIKNYRRRRVESIKRAPFRPAGLQILETGSVRLIDSDGRERRITDPSVKVMVPSLGRSFAKGMAAALRGMGWNAHPFDECDQEALSLGKSVMTNKECLPIINILGEILKYMKYRHDENELLVVTMVGAGGCCRVGQYETLIDRTIAERKLKNVVQLVLSNDDGFAGLGIRFRINTLRVLYAADILDDIRAAAKVLARDREEALGIIDRETDLIFQSIAGTNSTPFFKQIKRSSRRIAQIPRTGELGDTPVIGVVGEIFVRRDHFSLMGIPDKLAENGFIMADAPVTEWLRYTDFLREIDMYDVRRNLAGRLEYLAADLVHDWIEKHTKKLFRKSGLYRGSKIRIKEYLAHSSHFFPLEFTGEPGLCSGSALYHLGRSYAGVIAVGPFGCMNARMTEGVATAEMNVAGKIRAEQNAGIQGGADRLADQIDTLPFLNLEFDGTPLTQIDESRLETFLFQAQRLAEIMRRRKIDTESGKPLHQVRNTAAEESLYVGRKGY